MNQKRAYKYRWYPTAQQEQILARTFGCARFVYNWALALRTDAYYQQHQHIGYHETSARLTQLKQQPEYSWLNEVASVPLQQALRHLDRAFVHFFAGATSYPTFHSKHHDQSATYIGSAFTWDGTTLTLAKLANAQRRLAKKQKGSKNRAQARRKLARIHARLADRRRDS